MKISIKETVEVTLVLNKVEALWLKGVMQNPIGCAPDQSEAEKDKRIRSLLWATLEGVK